MKFDCVVIGAGASGLMATLELLRAGKKVLLLEARDRAGGRIRTETNTFSDKVELGAEFIHGSVPLTSKLLEEAKISSIDTRGEMYSFENGKLSKENFMEHALQQVTQALTELKHDMPFGDFLDTVFPKEKYASLRRHIIRFVEGYNAANIKTASAFALRNEWSVDDQPKQSRPEGGYISLVKYLQEEILQRGVELKYSRIVSEIRWQPGEAIVRTVNGESYHAGKVVITVPLGVLQSGKIRFTPALPHYINAAAKTGFGSVIKFHFRFTEEFWRKAVQTKFPNVQFIFSDAVIPTWWTQSPNDVPILTGWLGGPAVDKFEDHSQALTELAAGSLKYLFATSDDQFMKHLVASKATHWRADPFACGAYSFATMQTQQALTTLRTPVEDTLYFAGEALYEGPHTGTVEAALTNGKVTAKTICTSMK